MLPWSESERLLGNILATYGVSLPAELLPDQSYLWSSSGRIHGFINPVAERYRFDDLQQLHAVRHVPLLLLPQRSFETGQTELLFKEHDRWHAVLPSVELSPIRSDVDYVQQAIVRHARSQLGCDVPPAVYPAGGILSFKSSPSYGESNAYVFPLFAVIAAGEGGTTGTRAQPARGHRYLTQSALHKKRDVFLQPNGDVYRGLGKLHPGWQSLLGFDRRGPATQDGLHPDATDGPGPQSSDSPVDETSKVEPSPSRSGRAGPGRPRR